MGELVKTIIGSSAVVTLLLAIVGGVVKLVSQRSVNRREDDRDDAVTVGQMRAQAEAHVLGFDVPLVQAVLELRAEANAERIARGEPPRQWEPLPDSFPLFPKPKG